MSTELDLDIAALVGEMEDLECEHSQHGSAPQIHGGDATHYVRGVHSCLPPTPAYAACESFVGKIKSGGLVGCGNCKSITSWDEAFEILGPVSS